MKKFFPVIIAICVTVIVEEIRAALLVKEMQRRYNEQSVALASMLERIEMLEPPNRSTTDKSNNTDFRFLA